MFRRIWLASLLSNFGLLIQGVGSAWAMTQLDSAPQMVALVQSALMLPTMLFSLVAGNQSTSARPAFRVPARATTHSASGGWPRTASPKCTLSARPINAGSFPLAINHEDRPQRG